MDKKLKTIHLDENRQETLSAIIEKIGKYKYILSDPLFSELININYEANVLNSNVSRADVELLEKANNIYLKLEQVHKVIRKNHQYIKAMENISTLLEKSYAKTRQTGNVVLDVPRTTMGTALEFLSEYKYSSKRHKNVKVNIRNLPLLTPVAFTAIKDALLSAKVSRVSLDKHVSEVFGVYEKELKKSGITYNSDTGYNINQ